MKILHLLTKKVINPFLFLNFFLYICDTSRLGIEIVYVKLKNVLL